ncbi:hypothetical protein [Roseisolibacter agri]|uniref:hypothetical protein n=1 Tax=Roseisolibacter agri TaxID=2014610 RepID=UPI0024E07047|nr:hypothetical protein [Roseisolibacter agri]
MRAMRPCTTAAGFQHDCARAAVVRLAEELERAGERPATIVRLAVELLPLGEGDAGTVFGVTLRDWVRTTVRGALRGPVFDRRVRPRVEER